MICFPEGTFIDFITCLMSYRVSHSSTVRLLLDIFTPILCFLLSSAKYGRAYCCFSICASASFALPTWNSFGSLAIFTSAYYTIKVSITFAITYIIGTNTYFDVSITKGEFRERISRTLSYLPADRCRQLRRRLCHASSADSRVRR